MEHLSGTRGPRAFLSFKFPLIGRDGSALLGGMAFDVTDLRRAEERVHADLQAMTRLYDLATLCAAPGHDRSECLAQILEAAIAFSGARFGTLRLVTPWEPSFLNARSAVGASAAGAAGSPKAIYRNRLNTIACRRVLSLLSR